MTKRPKGALCDEDLKNEPRLSGFVNREVKARGGYCHIWAIWVCAAVKGMVFKQFTLG